MIKKWNVTKFWIGWFEKHMEDFDGFKIGNSNYDFDRKS